MLGVFLAMILVAPPPTDAPAPPESVPELALEPIDYNLADPDRDVADYLIPAAVVPAVNLAYWLAGKYILQDYFADISWSTMRGNIQHGWVFDDDIFAINQFGHPYQGNNYYTAARSSGLSFWESTPYVLGGSLMWEYLMESGPACCYPSVNDLVTTTLGGIAVGEILWRLSSAVLDDSSSGGERVLRESAAFVINPVRGLYRVSSIDAFTTGPAPLKPNAMWGEVSIGASLFGSGATEDFAVIPRYRLRSGHIRDLGDNFEPFDHLTLDLALGFSKEGLAGATFDVTGLLAGTTFVLGDDNSTVLGVAMDFDYFNNVLASLSQSGLGGLAAIEIPIGVDLSLFGRLLLLGSFGAITTDYSDIRNYSVGVGATARLWLELRHVRWGDIYIKADRYWVHTVSGMPGEEIAGVLDAGGTFAVIPGLGLGFHYLLADKAGFYRSATNTAATIHLGEAYVAWRF